MTSADRNRRLEQPLLFDPPRVLPAWSKLPAATQQSLIRLLAQMLQDGGARLATPRKMNVEEAEDE